MECGCVYSTLCIASIHTAQYVWTEWIMRMSEVTGQIERTERWLTHWVEMMITGESEFRAPAFAICFEIATI